MPIDQGWGVATPNVSADNSTTWNVRLTLPYGGSISLWAETFVTAFQMGGTTAQSQYMRQFFPHNFMQPSITISGTMPNQYQYNRLAAFVRASHFEAVNFSTTTMRERYIRSQGGNIGELPHYRTNNGNGIPTVMLEFTRGSFASTNNKNRVHKSWSMEGYILTIGAGSTALENTPAFQFDFIPVSSSLSSDTGIYSDTTVQGRKIEDWMTAFRGNSRLTYKQTNQSSDAANIIGQILGQIGL